MNLGGAEDCQTKGGEAGIRTQEALARPTVFKTPDGGRTWRNASAGLKPGVRPFNFILMNVLAVDPHQSRIVYAGTLNGVFKTTDGGRRWHAANIGLELP